VKDEAMKKMTIIAMAMPDRNINRSVKQLVKVEFTGIYSSFYNSFTSSGNVIAYVWRGEFKTIFAYETFQENHLPAGRLTIFNLTVTYFIY